MSMKQTLKFAGCVLQNLPNMSPEEMQRLIDDPVALKHAISGLAPENGVLGAMTAGPPLEWQGVPRDFLEDYDNVYLAPGFERHILLRASGEEQSVSGECFLTASLRRDATDREILHELDEFPFPGIDEALGLFAAVVANGNVVTGKLQILTYTRTEFGLIAVTIENRSEGFLLFDAFSLDRREWSPKDRIVLIPKST